MKPLEFEGADRTFRCEVRTSPATPGTDWWWITVSGESQRYAAFRAEPGDSESSVKRRVVAYYTQMVADRERPREARPSWAQRRAATTAAPS